MQEARDDVGGNVEVASAPNELEWCTLPGADVASCRQCVNHPLVFKNWGQNKKVQKLAGRVLRVTFRALGRRGTETMRMLISSVGTRGDLQPVVALALEVRELGHKVRM